MLEAKTDNAEPSTKVEGTQEDKTPISSTDIPTTPELEVRPTSAEVMFPLIPRVITPDGPWTDETDAEGKKKAKLAHKL